MEMNDILALVKAGYTKDEIALFNSPMTETAIERAEPAPEPAPEPVPQAPAEPVQQAPAGSEPQQPTTADLMKEIAKLTSAIQANAIANSTIPANMKNPPDASAIMAEIIRPTYKGGKE